jgi:hypothetical protein
MLRIDLDNMLGIDLDNHELSDCFAPKECKNYFRHAG